MSDEDKSTLDISYLHLPIDKAFKGMARDLIYAHIGKILEDRKELDNIIGTAIMNLRWNDNLKKYFHDIVKDVIEDMVDYSEYTIQLRKKGDADK